MGRGPAGAGIPASRSQGRASIQAFLTDTHPLLWFAQGARKKLGRKALAAFDAYEAGSAQLVVPTPVVLETYFLARRGTLLLQGTLTSWWRRISSPQLILEPLTADDVLSAADLDWAHVDIYDRLIAATALRLALPLVTADSALTDWGAVKVLW